MNGRIKKILVITCIFTILVVNCLPIYASSLNLNDSNVKQYTIINYFLNRNNNSSAKEKFVLYCKSILNPYIKLTENPEQLATVVANLCEEEFTMDTVNTCIKQLLKAFLYTTSGIPTQKDLDDLTTQLTNGEYYYPDMPGKDVKYASIKDICRFCNFSTMFNSMYNSTGNIQITDEIQNPNPTGKPISIGKVSEFNWKNPQTGKIEKIDDVWLVGLAGTSFVENQSSGLIADILSGCENNSPYLEDTLKAITTKIPKGSKIMLAGFSLGGMIAQQVMVQDIILENYDIVQVTVVGCPPLCIDERITAFEKYDVDVNINRVVDKYDLIPYLSIDYLIKCISPTSSDIQENLLIDRAKNRYKTFIGTHFLGYLKEDCWDNYDALGNKVGRNDERATIVLNLDNFEFFDAPTKFLPDELSKYE